MRQKYRYYHVQLPKNMKKSPLGLMLQNCFFSWYRSQIQLPVGFRTWLWRYTCLLLLIAMLWYRQAIFESKGDKLPSSAECKIRTQGLWNRISNRMNARRHTDWAIEDQAKSLNSMPVPMISEHSAHLTAGWLSHLALAIYTFVVNFNALYASHGDGIFKLDERRVVFALKIHSVIV